MTEHMKFAEREDPEKPSRSNAPLTLGGFGVFVVGLLIATGNGGQFVFLVGLVATALLVVGLVRPGMTEKTEKRTGLNWPLGIGVFAIGLTCYNLATGYATPIAFFVGIVGTGLLVVGLMRR